MHSVGNTKEKGRFSHQFKLLFFTNLLSYFIPLRKVGINDEQSGLMSSQMSSTNIWGEVDHVGENNCQSEVYAQSRTLRRIRQT